MIEALHFEFMRNALLAGLLTSIACGIIGTLVVVSHDLSVLSSYVKSVACLNQTLYFHDSAEITQEMIDMAYHCPVDLIAHGLPHRVLRKHG